LGSGDGASATSQWSGAVGKGCFCIFPTVIQKDEVAWNTEREERYVLELIERAKRSLSIDTNRIYVVGHSMGGFGTWSIGGIHADRFAALSANAGGVPVGDSLDWVEKGRVANLYSTPMFFFHSVDDKQVPWDRLQVVVRHLEELKAQHPKGYPYLFKPYKNIGHGFPSDWNTQKIIEWVTKHKRDPYPEKVIWEPMRSYKQVFFNLYIKDPPALWGAKDAARIILEFKNKSLIEIKTENGAVVGLSVLLNSKQMLSKKPLSIYKNGKEVFQGIPEYSAWALLVSIGQNRDPEQYFMGAIPIPDSF
jgi:predicted esterase